MIYLLIKISRKSVRWFKYIVFFIITLCLITTISFYSLVKKEDISAYIYNEIGAVIQFSDYGISLYPSPSLKLTKIKYDDKKSITIDAKNLLISFSFSGLNFSKNLKIKSFYINEPKIIISKTSNTSEDSTMMDIKKIKVKNAQVFYDTYEIKNVNLDASLENSILVVKSLNFKTWKGLKDVNIKGNVDLKSYAIISTININELDINKFIGSAETKDSSKSKKDFDLRPYIKLLENINITSSIKIDKVKVKNTSALNINLKVENKNNLLKVNPIKFDVYDGKVKGIYTVNYKNKKPKFKINQEVKSLELSEIFENKEKPLKGKVNLLATLSFEGVNKKQILKSLEGVKTLYGKNLTLNNYDIDSILKEYEKTKNVNLLDVGAMLLVGPFAGLFTQGTKFAMLKNEVDKKGSTKVKEFSSMWDIKGVRAIAKDVAFKTNKNIVALKGEINIVSKKFNNIQIAVLDENKCVKYMQTLKGDLNTNEVELKQNAAETFFSPITGLFNSAKKLIKGCKPFYRGRVK